MTPEHGQGPAAELLRTTGRRSGGVDGHRPTHRGPAPGACHNVGVRSQRSKGLHLFGTANRPLGGLCDHADDRTIGADSTEYPAVLHARAFPALALVQRLHHRLHLGGTQRKVLGPHLRGDSRRAHSRDWRSLAQRPRCSAHLRAHPHFLNALFFPIGPFGEHHRHPHETLNLPVAMPDADCHL